MQHVLRCWERQSDGREYKKTLRRPGPPDPAGGAYSAPVNPLAGGEGLDAPPQEPNSPFSALRSSPVLLHSKISSDAVVSDS